MKILFIEADKWLDDEMEIFAFKLNNDGHDVQMVVDCYSRISAIKDLLIDFKPEVIFVQTTFVYSDKFVLFKDLYQYITYPVELWYAGNYTARMIEKYIPENKRELFTYFDIWMLEYGNELLNDCWKRPA